MTDGSEEEQSKQSSSKTTEKVEKHKERASKSGKKPKALFSYSTSKAETKPYKSEVGQQSDTSIHQQVEQQRSKHKHPPCKTTLLPNISQLTFTNQGKRSLGCCVKLAPLLIQPSTVNSGKSKELKAISKDCAKVFQKIIPDFDSSILAGSIHPKRFLSRTVRHSRVISSNKRKYNNSNTSTSSIKQKKNIRNKDSGSPVQDFSETRPDVVQLYQNEVLQCCRKTPPFLKYWNQHCKFNSYRLASKSSRLAIVCVPFTNKELLKSNSRLTPNSSSSVVSISTTPQSENARKSVNYPSKSNTITGLTAIDLSNLPIDLTEICSQYADSNKTQSSQLKKTSAADTGNIISSLRKAMNSKPTQRIGSKNAQSVLQQQPRRGRPHGGKNTSSSFILPYGIENQIQQSSSHVIPSSSSFHGGPLESLQLMSENHHRTIRQQSLSTNSQRLQRKFLDRQKFKMLKPLTTHKHQSSFPKFYEMSPSEFKLSGAIFTQTAGMLWKGTPWPSHDASSISAAILPDSSATYRFAHDVSFDEGSRYRTTDLNNGFKANTSDHGLNGLSRQFTSAIAMRHNENGRHDLRISGREHSSNGTHTMSKDAATLSIVKADDKCELPPTLSSTSPTVSSAIVTSTSNSSFIPPPSASRPNVSSSNSTPSTNITFRLHKEKQNWNNRLGELSVNGGGYSNSLHGSNNNVKADIEPVMRMNMTSAVQRNLQTRERVLAAAPKSRISSRYSNKNGSACSEPNYADPCIAAPPSYQQRLMDLSMLESETVKYERNRKLKRKKNQDKDS